MVKNFLWFLFINLVIRKYAFKSVGDFLQISSRYDVQ